MTDVSTLLRRYMDLFEGLDATVSVTIDAYVGMDQLPGTSAAIPAVLMFEIDSDLTQDEATIEIKAQIQATTGYEPARFTWKPIAST